MTMPDHLHQAFDRLRNERGADITSAKEILGILLAADPIVFMAAITELFIEGWTASGYGVEITPKTGVGK